MNLSLAGREVELSRSHLFIMVLALLLVGYGGYDYVQQVHTIENAVPVSATISEVGVAQSGAPGFRHYPETTFEYEYEGTTYNGDAVFPGRISLGYDSRSGAREVVDRYAVGDTVTAYVDPESPTDAFLEKETSSGPLLVAGFGVVVFLVGLVQGRQAATDDAQTDPGKRTGRGSEAGDRTVLGLDHGRLGTACKRFVVVSFVATWLSVMGFVLALLFTASNTSTQSTSPEPALSEPLGVLFLVASLSGTALVVSLFTYSGWSYLEGRRLRATLQLEGHRGLATVLFADEDHLNRYERRVRLTVISLLAGTVLLTAFLDVVGVINLPR